MIILGIDPGHSRIGYGILDVQRIITLRAAGIIEITQDKIEKKFVSLDRTIKRLISQHSPDLLAIETMFFSKNKTTALRVAEARGVILARVASYNIPIREINPMTVKKIVGGHGSVSKASLARCAELLLNTKIPNGPDDISDAVAVALACALSLPLRGTE